MAFQIIGESSGKNIRRTTFGISCKSPASWMVDLAYGDKICGGRVSFMDEQRVGPYKLWLHTHKLEDVDGGTRMTDDIRYIVPFGPIGWIANALFVGRTLRRIFDYRRVKMDEIFGKAE